MQLSIIIVNYNVKFFLEHCLLSVTKACRDISAEIIVFDNNSTDGSKEYLVPKFSSVKFIWNSINLGFGKANNEAVSVSSGKHILFLNPDTILPETCLKDCLCFFKENVDCGALGVRMIDGSGTFLKESKRCLPTPSSGLYKMIGLASLFPNSSVFAKYYAGYLPENKNNKVEVLAGAFMMLSKKAIELSNGFDESFFMYGEDIDLSYRIIKAGLQNYYLGDTTIIHFKGESTQKKDKTYVKHFYGAMKLFVAKHYKHNSLKYTLMKIAISLGEITAKFKTGFISNPSNPFSIPSYNTVFIGEETQFEQVKSLLSGSNFLPPYCYSFNRDYTIEKIKKYINEKNIDTIVLGESETFPNSEIIRNLSLLSADYKFLFYQNGAYSIVGSHNKNETGIFISRQ